MQGSVRVRMGKRARGGRPPTSSRAVFVSSIDELNLVSTPSLPLSATVLFV